MSQPQYGVFGAAFDPPTLGHQNAIEQCFTHFDTVLVVPSAAHAFGKQMSPFKHRLAMLKLLCQTWDDQKVRMETIEQELLKHNPEKPVYSFDLLQALEAKYQLMPSQLTLILGPDTMSQWHRFYRHQDIDTRWQRLEVQECIDVHGIDVRQLVSKTYQQPQECLVALMEKVPKGIAQYIIDHNLYTPP